MRTRSLIAVGLIITCLPAVGRGDEWPQFRGPGGAGLSGEKQLPLEWGGGTGFPACDGFSVAQAFQPVNGQPPPPKAGADRPRKAASRRAREGCGPGRRRGRAACVPEASGTDFPACGKESCRV